MLTSPPAASLSCLCHPCCAGNLLKVGLVGPLLLLLCSSSSHTFVMHTQLGGGSGNGNPLL
jgi:hypothetical protein